MARILSVLAAALVLIAMVAGPASALPPPMPLEDRVADSDLVVAGEIVKVADESARGGPADHVRFQGQVRCTVKVTRVFKGPADLKQVTVVCRKPAPAPKAPPGIKAVRIGGAFRRAEVGEKAIWTLVKQPQAEGVVYRELYYHPVHEQDTAEAVAAAAKVAADPAKVLKDDKAAERQRLSAAYLYLRWAVPEDALPQTRTPLPGGGTHTEANTLGHALLDAALVDRAVEAAIRGLASTESLDGKPYAWPGAHGLALKALQRVVRNFGNLRPEPVQTSRQQTRKEMIEDTRQQRKAWAEAVRAWWDKHKMKLYVPKVKPRGIPGGR